MAYVAADRVKETGLVIGTGSITCLGAVSGYLPFSSKMSIGDTCSYITFNPSQSQWETGIGTYSASGTISRTTVKTSSNNNSKVVFNGDVVNILMGQSVNTIPNYNPVTQTLSANPVSSGLGNNLNIIGGSGVISGSGGNLVLQGGGFAGSGLPGNVVVKKVSGQTSNLQEWQNSDGTVVASIGNDGSIWTSGTNTVPLKPINYTYTGTLDAEPIIILSTPTPAQTGNTVGDYSGKWVQSITLSVANRSLTSISFTDLQGISGSFSPNNMTSLTSLSCPALTTIAGSFVPANMSTITSLSFPSLTTIGNIFGPSSMSTLTSLNFPALTTVGGLFNPNILNAITSCSFPSLTTIGGNFTPNSMGSLTSLSLPSLTTIGGNFTPNINSLTSLSLPALRIVAGSINPTLNGITSLSLPALTVIGSFAPNGMTSLTSISIPAIIQIGGSITISTGTAALTTFQLPSTLLQVNTGVTITSAALNQASVDSILVRLAALDGTNGTTLFSNKTVTITGTSSTPSATGLAAKATLVARGCTVTTN